MRTNPALWMRSVLVFTSFIMIAGCFDSPTDVTQRRPRNQQKVTTPIPPQSSRLCLMFRESLWQEFRFGEDSQDEVIHTVTSLWDGLNESQIESVELYGNDDVHWGVVWGEHSDRGGRVHYHAEGSNVRKLIYIRVELDPAPTLAQILECLGASSVLLCWYPAKLCQRTRHRSLVCRQRTYGQWLDPRWESSADGVSP